MKNIRKISLLFLFMLAGVVGFSQVTMAKTVSGMEVEDTEDEPGDTPEGYTPLSELTFDEYSFAPILVGQEPVFLDVQAFYGFDCKWESETPDIATVDEKGQVTPIMTGIARIRVVVTAEDGEEYTFLIPLRIVNPHFENSSSNLASGCYLTIEIKDSSGEPVTFSTTDKKKVSLVRDEGGSIIVKAGKKIGTATITVVADGVTLTYKITVTNPKLKTSYGFFEKNKRFSIDLTGTNKTSKPVWTSSDVKVASINSSGSCKTKKTGSVLITCQVDGKTLVYNLAVAKKTVVKALRWGYSKVGKCHYSQAKRMSKKYFDCSSFAYRCYRAAGKYLVSKSSWAPVAADIGKYYVQKKKQIKPTGASYDMSKLRPGDLICYGGKNAKKNGRYKRINHIAIYIGNGQVMESSSSKNNVVIREQGFMKKRDIPVVVRPA